MGVRLFLVAMAVAAGLKLADGVIYVYEATHPLALVCYVDGEEVYSAPFDRWVLDKPNHVFIIEYQGALSTFVGADYPGAECYERR